jgi:TolB-like protein
VSYASEDAEAAHRLCSSLRTAGIDVWLDQSELQGGDAWERQIRDRICDCRLFIAIVSSNTEARDEGFFRREWKLAVDRIDDLAEDVTFLLPVSIDGTIQARARVPRKFLEVQWTTLPRGNATPEFIHRVVRLLGRETGIVEQRPVARPDASKQLLPKSRIRPILTTTVAVAIAGALAYGVVERRRQATIPLALRSVAVGSAQTGDRSLAVLPFVDMSEKHDQEFFADGMSEEILDVLTRIPELTVIGRTSSFQFKGKNEDLRTIGRQLGTTYVVEGSVRRSGDRVRVTAQLIDTRSGSHVWSESYDRDMGDVLMLQNTIATSIARKLQLAVTSSGSATAGLPRNIDAYTLYLRGREAFDRGDVAAYTEAQQYFEQALALDSTSSRAAEGVLLSYINRVYAGEIESAVGWPKVRSLAQNLLELDPQSSFAHSALSWYHYLYDYDWIACNREIDAVIATRSHEPNTLVYAAYACS